MALGALPPSNDEFWGDATKIAYEGKSKECKHRFIYKSAIEAECNDCHIGFFLLGDEEEVKDGHIYKNGKFVI